MSGDEDGRAFQSAAAGMTGSTAALRPRSPDAADRSIGTAARTRIGRSLRRHYAEALALPIPDRLRTLLDALDATEAQR